MLNPVNASGTLKRWGAVGRWRRFADLTQAGDSRRVRASAAASSSVEIQQGTSNSGTLTCLTIETPSGRIAFAEAGTGPVALFVHGVLRAMPKGYWIGRIDVKYVDYLVVGRPVTEAADPKKMADAIVAEIERTTTN